MSLKLSKSVPGLVVEAGELDNRMGMFEQSNAYNPDAPGISAKLSKGKDPFASVNLDLRADATLPFQKSEPAKDCGYMEKSDLEDALEALCKADEDDEEEEDPDPAATEAAKEEKKGNPPEKPTGDMPDFGKSEEALDDLIKGAGEGSRGGKIVGHTRSGKPIYDSFSHPSHKEFSANDHHDAAGVHYGKADRARKQENKDAHSGMADPHSVKAEDMDYENPPKPRNFSDKDHKVLSSMKPMGDHYLHPTDKNTAIMKFSDFHAGPSTHPYEHVVGDKKVGYFKTAKEALASVMHKNPFKRSVDAGDVSVNGEDPKIKRHKRQFDELRRLHENSTELQKKSLRGERTAARLKKCIIDEVRLVIKGYGAENLIDTHGEQFMSDADKEVLNFIRSIERLDVDLCPTHNPPVPRSYASHKSMTAEQEESFIAGKAFD